ncbi:MAG: HNH endonuclease signature motif containing protein [Planctomycetota bacterium]
MGKAKDPSPAEDERDRALGEAIDAYLERVQRGEQLSVEEWVRRFPGLEEELRECLSALPLLEPPSRETPPASTPGGALGLRGLVPKGGRVPNPFQTPSDGTRPLPPQSPRAPGNVLIPPSLLDAANGAMVRCDAEVVDVAAKFDAIAERAQKEVEKRAFEKASGGSLELKLALAGVDGAGALSEMQRERDINTPKWLRDLVLARDGYRCRCCGCRLDLMIHHIEWLSLGGRTEPGNLVVLCARCHGRVHALLLIVEGKAPHEVRFLDRRGEELTKWKGGVGPVLNRLDGARVHLEGAPQTAPSEGTAHGARAPCAEVGAEAAAPRALSLEEIPAQVDAEWWRRNSQYFQWNDRRGAFQYQGGISS